VADELATSLSSATDTDKIRPDAARPNPPEKGQSAIAVARVLVLIGGLAIVALGVLGGLAAILSALLGPQSQAMVMVTFGFSLLLLCLGLGSALAWTAWQSIQERSSRPFRPHRVWILGALFVLAVAAGQLILQLEVLPLLTFPPLHVAAAVLPPATVLALVSRSLGGSSSQRDAVLQLGSGAFVATTLAIALELMVVLGLVGAILAVIALQPGGLEQIQGLTQQMQGQSAGAPSWIEDPAELVSLARSPIVVGAAFLIVVVLVPLIEEATKAVGVVLRWYRRPNLSQAYLWGLAGGAGFALVEGLFNSLGGLDVWALAVSVRVGASLLHCFNGALMGIAWFNILARRRWLRGAALYAIAVGIHGLWNGVSAGMAFLSLDALMGVNAPSDGGLAGAGMFVLLSLLLSMIVALGLALAGLTRYVHRQAVATSGPQPAVVSPRVQNDKSNTAAEAIE
jgi:hypothetical protein